MVVLRRIVVETDKERIILKGGNKQEEKSTANNPRTIGMDMKVMQQTGGDNERGI